jgi:hypothetical protein
MAGPTDRILGACSTNGGFLPRQGLIESRGEPLSGRAPWVGMTDKTTR